MSPRGAVGKLRKGKVKKINKVKKPKKGIMQKMTPHMDTKMGGR